MGFHFFYEKKKSINIRKSKAGRASSFSFSFFISYMSIVNTKVVALTILIKNPKNDLPTIFISKLRKINLSSLKRKMKRKRKLNCKINPKKSKLNWKIN
jgi:hypothetical protein